MNAVPLLAGLDVATPAAMYNLEQYPGEPTVVVAGNNVIDGTHVSVPTDSSTTPSGWLAGELYSQRIVGAPYSTDASNPAYGVTDAGIQSNMVLSDGESAGGVPGGPSLLARVDRDILAEPDVGTVIIDEGLEDLLASDGSATTAQDLGYAYALLQQQLQYFGVQSQVFGMLTPCGGFTDSTDSQQCDAQVEAARVEVNGSIGGPGGYGTADFSAALDSGDGASPADLAAAYDDGDHVNLTTGSGGGYAALGTAVSTAIADGTSAIEPPLTAFPETTASSG
jgi:hypothetical protein